MADVGKFIKKEKRKQYYLPYNIEAVGKNIERGREPKFWVR